MGKSGLKTRFFFIFLINFLAKITLKTSFENNAKIVIKKDK